VRSVRSLIVLAALPLLTGCATTQDRNARAKLDATRLLAARRPTVVGAPNPDVRVGKVALLHHDGAVAVVVELRNVSRLPLTDLPIAVGLRRGGRERALNGRGGLAYFQSHVAAIGPGATTAWVFTAPHLEDLSGEPYAVVGRPAQPPISAAASLPTLAVAPASPLGAVVRIRIANHTQVPQYGLPVYAFARRGSRYTAAGRTTLHHLGTGAAKEVRLTLIGSTRGARLSVQSQPSIFE
jgi:hypothetical protein